MRRGDVKQGYEYLWYDTDFRDAKRLTDLGSQGWRVVHVTESDSTPRALILLERKYERTDKGAV